MPRPANLDNPIAMTLWLLRPIKGDSLWEPWYDKAFGFVVRAETRQRARKLAAAEAADETAAAWSAQHATCVELTPEGAEEVVMRDFAGA